MRAGLEIARFFNVKVREGARGRKNLIPDAAKWRSSNPGSLAVIHSSSAGEFEASLPLIRALKKRGMLTTATLYSPSGYKIARKNSEPDVVLYLPFDSRRAIKAFLKALHPDLFIFCKHDIWPNVMWECEAQGIITAVVNANLHQRSFRLNPLLIGFNRHIFKKFNTIFTVSQEHAERLDRILGFSGKVQIPGDTRFDRVVARAVDAEIELPDAFRGNPVFIGGSVWDTEMFVLDSFLEIRRKNPQWRLIWVPHEPSERVIERVESALAEAGMSCIRFSEFAVNRDAQALIVDKVGVLSPLYRFADIAYVGGGFGKGVHSVIEPAVFSIPVIFGPNHYVSAEAGELLKRGGGFTVNNRDDCFSLLNNLISDDKMRLQAGHTAGAMVKEKSGVAEIIADKLMELM